MITIKTSARILIEKDKFEVFTTATNNQNIFHFFTGYGPIPAIVKVTLIEGDEVKPGAVRLVENADGAKLRERILQFEPGKVQEYEIESGFTPPFSWLVKKGRGHWTFEGEGNGTLVSWNFEFTLQGPHVFPMAFPIAKIFFAKAQRRCLANIKKACE